MENPRYAVFVDLENAGAKVTTLKNIIEHVKMRGEILLGKVYGYTDKFDDLKEVLLSNTFNVVPSLRFGHNQKNNLDIQLVIDAMEVAYKNDLINCFCIVSGDSDYTPLVGKLKSMGKYVLGISRSEAASGIFINACNEFIFLESVSRKQQQKADSAGEDTLSDEELNKQIESILAEYKEAIHASELKSTLVRLRPDFNESSYGFSTFGKLLSTLESRYKSIHVYTDNSSLMVSQKPEERRRGQVIGKENWIEAFRQQLDILKDSGFDRVNPSIIKAAIQTEYPDFDERKLGYKRFSDIMKRLEKEDLVRVEMDNSKTMLIKII